MRCGHCDQLVGVVCRCVPPWLRTDPRVRAAVQRKDLGGLVKLLRAHTDLSQGVLGNIAGLDQSTISRLESGRTRSQDPRLFQRAVAGLGLDGPVGSGPAAQPSARPPTAPVAPWQDTGSWWEGGELAALETALGFTSRRTVMALAGSALAAQTLQWALADPVGARRAGEGGPVGEPLTDGLAQSVDTVRMADAQGGASPALRAMAQTQLEFLHQLLRSGQGRTDRAPVLGLAGDLAGLLGWMAVDAGEDRAQALLLAALRTAHAAGDPVLGAGIISYLAVHTYSQGQGREAALMASTALHRVSGLASPYVECVLWNRQARGHAVAGQERQARRALDAAFEAFEQGPREDDPRWLYWIDAGEVHGQAGSTLAELGHYDLALEHTDQALAGYRPECVRNQASALVRAARTLAAQGEVDHACDRTHQALDLVETLDSARTTGQVLSLLDDLGAHRGHAGVAAVLERARPLVAGGDHAG